MPQQLQDLEPFNPIGIFDPYTPVMCFVDAEGKHRPGVLEVVADLATDMSQRHLEQSKVEGSPTTDRIGTVAYEL